MADVGSTDMIKNEIGETSTIATSNVENITYLGLFELKANNGQTEDMIKNEIGETSTIATSNVENITYLGLFELKANNGQTDPVNSGTTLLPQTEKQMYWG